MGRNSPGRKVGEGQRKRFRFCMKDREAAGKHTRSSKHQPAFPRAQSFMSRVTEESKKNLAQAQPYLAPTTCPIHRSLVSLVPPGGGSYKLQQRRTEEQSPRAIRSR